MQLPPHLKLSRCVLSLLAVAALGISCASRRSLAASPVQVLGDVAARLETYAQSNGSGWSAVILLTNISNATIQCMANSYAAGLILGSRAVQAKELKSETLPKTLVWTRRTPEMHMDPRMMVRYGMGKVFDLDPGKHIRLALPIYVPQAHPDDFVEHFVVGFRRSSSSADSGEYETYVAEVKRR